MSFDLQGKPLVGQLASLWPGKTIREMPYRELKSVMAAAPADHRAEAIAAAAIGVSLDDILNLPGRYSGSIAQLLSDVSELHGLNTGDDEEPPVNGTTVAGESLGKH